MMIALIVFCLCLSSVFSLNDAMIKALKNAELAATRKLNNIYKEWQIDLYPLFLSSCTMHKESWLKMKDKYTEKILKGEIGHPGTKDTQQFEMSFMGSSVTAGHDSLFSQSYPMIVAQLMDEPLAAANITLKVWHTS